MKVAVLSESSADEAAVRILVAGVLGIPVRPVEALPRLQSRPRGWASLMNLAPTVLKHLYYRTDADGLVMVLDSNHTPVHDGSHEPPNLSHEKCRVCRLLQRVEDARIHLNPVPGRTSLRLAVGLAVPCVEA